LAGDRRADLTGLHIGSWFAKLALGDIQYESDIAGTDARGATSTRQELLQAGEELVEQGRAVGLVVVGGVVTLALQGGPELDAGLEEGAGLADGLEGAARVAGCSRRC
jgi:hypothetical protein